MELTPTASAPLPLPPWQRFLEITLVFAIFFAQGAWPAPDSNEQSYVGKAIHYWNPEWIPNDFYLNSADSHLVFCFSTGWLSFWLAPTPMTWVIRIAIWGLMAWGWWRLSWALVPRRWYALLTAALFVCLVERCNLAGEWVVGGAEGKGFAYGLVFFGLEALVRQRWNRAWLLFGAAAMFHVLVGGWAVLAAGIGWCLAGAERPKLSTMLPGLLGGFLLSLPGLIPSLQLTWGVDAEIVRRANWIYVYERLPHHLVFGAFPWRYRRLLFGALVLSYGVFCGLTPRRGPTGAVQRFVAGALAIALLGIAMNGLERIDPARATALLRLYWFRMSDVAAPLGVTLLGAWWIAEVWPRRVVLASGLLAVAVAAAGLHLGSVLWERYEAWPIPRTVRPYYYADWRDVCNWIAHAPEIPRRARFITPRLNATFKWYTGHAEVATNKDLPQDAISIVEWWDRLNRLYSTGSEDPMSRWYYSLTCLTPQQLRELGTRYEADYLLTASVPALELPLVHQSGFWAVYRLTPTAP